MNAAAEKPTNMSQCSRNSLSLEQRGHDFSEGLPRDFEAIGDRQVGDEPTADELNTAAVGAGFCAVRRV